MERCTGSSVNGEIGQGRRSAQWPCGKGACPQGAVRTSRDSSCQCGPFDRRLAWLLLHRAFQRDRTKEAAGGRHRARVGFNWFRFQQVSFKLLLTDPPASAAAAPAARPHGTVWWSDNSIARGLCAGSCCDGRLWVGTVDNCMFNISITLTRPFVHRKYRRPTSRAARATRATRATRAARATCATCATRAARAARACACVRAR